MSLCGICNKKTKSTTCVTCDICRRAIHPECADLTAIEVECIRSNSRKIHFYCEKCDIVATINNLKDEISVLKSELTALKTQQVNSADDLASTKKLSDEEIFAEIEERNYRAPNLILFNLPESDEDSPTKRKEIDVNRCVSTVTSTDYNASTSIVSCIRVGRYNKDRVRPVRIVFTSREQALDCLKAYKRKNNLYLNRDLTPRQQNYSYLIRSEFKTRKEQGEEDIMLKYRYGIPAIVKRTTKNN